MSATRAAYRRQQLLACSGCGRCRHVGGPLGSSPRHRSMDVRAVLGAQRSGQPRHLELPALPQIEASVSPVSDGQSGNEFVRGNRTGRATREKGDKQ